MCPVRILCFPCCFPRAVPPADLAANTVQKEIESHTRHTKISSDSTPTIVNNSDHRRHRYASHQTKLRA